MVEETLILRKISTPSNKIFTTSKITLKNNNNIKKTMKQEAFAILVNVLKLTIKKMIR